MFTGRFEFGGRKKCEEAIEKKGGITPNTKSVLPDLDFLVIGGKGSDRWSHGNYGKKIEAAILKRREFGKPAIISAALWGEALS